MAEPLMGDRTRTFTLTDDQGRQTKIRTTDLLIETAGRHAMVVSGTTEGVLITTWDEDGEAQEQTLTPSSHEGINLGWYRTA